MIFITILIGCILGAIIGMNVPMISYTYSSYLAILLTILGQKLNVDIYLAAIVVFVGRMFVNLSIIRRYYVDKWLNKSQNKDKTK